MASSYFVVCFAIYILYHKIYKESSVPPNVLKKLTEIKGKGLPPYIPIAKARGFYGGGR